MKISENNGLGGYPQELAVEAGGERVLVPFADILYLNKSGKYVEISYYHGGNANTKGNVRVISVRTSLSRISPVFPKNFVAAHRGHVVNTVHVLRQDYKSVLMRNGELIPVASGRSKAVRDVWRNANADRLIRPCYYGK